VKTKNLAVLVEINDRIETIVWKKLKMIDSHYPSG
jgi:hypothetical protein